MTKKTKISKKHRFKYAEPDKVNTSLSAELDEKSTNISQTVKHPSRVRSIISNSTVAGRDFNYVGSDVKRVGIFAASLVFIELVLWYLLAQTGLGSIVYSLIKV